MNGPSALHCSPLDSFIPPRVRSFARDSSEPLPNRRRRTSLLASFRNFPFPRQAFLELRGKRARDTLRNEMCIEIAREFNNRNNIIYRFSSLELYIRLSLSLDTCFSSALEQFFEGKKEKFHKRERDECNLL